jgi:hypothetical protein
MHVVTGCRHQLAIWAPGDAIDHITMTLRMHMRMWARATLCVAPPIWPHGEVAAELHITRQRL